MRPSSHSWWAQKAVDAAPTGHRRSLCLYGRRPAGNAEHLHVYGPRKRMAIEAAAVGLLAAPITSVLSESVMSWRLQLPGHRAAILGGMMKMLGRKPTRGSAARRNVLLSLLERRGEHSSTASQKGEKRDGNGQHDGGDASHGPQDELVTASFSHIWFGSPRPARSVTSLPNRWPEPSLISRWERLIDSKQGSIAVLVRGQPCLGSRQPARPVVDGTRRDSCSPSPGADVKKRGTACNPLQ